VTALGASVEAVLRDLIREAVRDGVLQAFERVRDDLVQTSEPVAPRKTEWMSIREVAAEVGVTAETVRSWVAAKSLTASRPSGKPRGRLKISRTALTRFLGTRDDDVAPRRDRPDPRAVAATILSSSSTK
jgi:excisionase family DNA binding protein